MRVFVIHSGSERSLAVSKLKALSTANNLSLDIKLLKRSYGSKWKDIAEKDIEGSELVIHFNPGSGESSENIKWELERAKELNKLIIEIDEASSNDDKVGQLRAAADFEEEFEDCFQGASSAPETSLELYKLMLASSEELIKRRQITNGFFITIIGALITITGLLLNSSLVTDANGWILLLPAVVGILLCRSWGNLVENYGKLNKGKFKVINRLECELPVQIFSAEWSALGKGLRPHKYRSFTDTEQIVPRLFMIMLGMLAALLFCHYLWTLIGHHLIIWMGTTDVCAHYCV